eukprot:TRINITY_DN8003_c0_g1_i12.p1 TRINITY_DN8003_c0_g1~~TRINITY_DN8003_c0_g1_i12.p1  ORF type:complete len:523 (-),score=104.01 TRINITY_DN8003_c0_g1_i12:293-1861(-)
MRQNERPSGWGTRHSDSDRSWGSTGNKSFGRKGFEPDWDRLEKKLFGDAKEAGSAIEAYDIPVKRSGSDMPEPLDSFNSALIHQGVLDNINRAKYTHPTPVQKHSIPVIAAGRDLMSCAQTGSGKTAAFLVPIISHLLNSPPAPQVDSRAAPSALILSPTRELATQIFAEASKFTFRTPIRPVVVYGGASMRDQIGELRRGCNLLIATPGRLEDLMERGHVMLRGVAHLCLDEADRMLDMGFEPQIRRIVQQADMPEDRQTLMFSATFPPLIQRMAADFMRDHVFLAVGITGSTTKNITQKFEPVENQRDKDSLLLDVLHAVPGLTIIFVETKRMADELEYYLRCEELSATSIHGDRDQREREDAIRTFKAGTTPYLVATDVASRGLDVPNVAHVINYDLPRDIDSYVHRIGRTARAGNTGIATSFVSQRRDANLAHSLVDILVESKQEIPGWLDNMGAHRGRAGPKSSSASKWGGSSNWGGCDAREMDRPAQRSTQQSDSFQSRLQVGVPAPAKRTHNYWD